MNQRKIGVVLSYVNILLKNLTVFIYTPFLLKYLGQAEYGLYQMTNSVIMSLSLLSMGFSGAYVRFYVLARNRDDNEGIKKLNGMYLLIFITISVLSLIIGSIIVSNTQNIFGRSFSIEEIKTTKILMSVLVLNITLTFPSSVFDAYIIVHEQFKFQQSRQVAQTVLGPILTVPLILFGFKSVAIVTVTTLLTCIFLSINVRYAIKKLGMRFCFRGLPFSLLKELAVFSFFIFLNQIIDLVNEHAPSFIIGVYLGAKEVTIYSIASQIKALFGMLSTSISGVFIPHINNLVNNNTEKSVLTDLMIRIGRVQLILLTFILGGFISIGKYFINVWAGPQNYLAYYIIIIMVFPTLVTLSQNIGIEIQRAMNKHYFRSILYSIFAIINLILTVLAVNIIGVMGAVFGFVFSVTVANGIIMNLYYHKKIGLNMKRFWKELSNIFIPFILSTGIVLSIQHFTGVLTLITFIIYGTIYVVLFLSIYYYFSASTSEKRIIKKISEQYLLFK